MYYVDNHNTMIASLILVLANMIKFAAVGTILIALLLSIPNHTQATVHTIASTCISNSNPVPTSTLIMLISKHNSVYT